jgi:hypothetical protein
MALGISSGTAADLIRAGHARYRPSLGFVCRSRPKGREAGRAARASANQVRVADQSKHRQDARPRGASCPSCASRRSSDWIALFADCPYLSDFHEIRPRLDCQNGKRGNADAMARVHRWDRRHSGVGVSCEGTATGADISIAFVYAGSAAASWRALAAEAQVNDEHLERAFAPPGRIPAQPAWRGQKSTPRP